MHTSTIQTLIDKVIGKKGLIRVPSWWMRKVLMQITDWVQEGDDANDKKIMKVKEEIYSLKPSIDTLRPDIDRLIQITSPYALVSGTGYIVINGSSNYFADADNLRINITGPIDFVNKGAATNNITRVKLCNTSYAILGKNLSYTFSNCQNLTSINLNSFDTYAVTNMGSMFNDCSSLTSLNLSSFDTSKVTDMSSMFSSCSRLPSLNLSSFDTSMVTDMRFMFGGCSSLISLDLSSFDTSAVMKMLNMFAGCSRLTYLILGLNFFKTPNVTSINFSDLTQWTNDTVVTSLITNSYDRAAAGLSTMKLYLSANTKAALTDEQKAAITAKGYTIA